MSSTANDVGYGYIERICPVCKKVFEISVGNAPLYHYRIEKKCYCSWTCYRKTIREIEEKAEEKRLRSLEAKRMRDKKRSDMRRMEGEKNGLHSSGDEPDSKQTG